MLSRRTVVAALATLSERLLAAPQSTRIWRVGILGVETWEATDDDRMATIEELRRRGYVEGKNLSLISRFSGIDQSRLDSLAQELVDLPVDLIVTQSQSAIRAVRRATTTIPVVMFASGDPVGSGFVQSLARPGGNVTGNALFGPELLFKQLEILIEVLGAPKHLVFLCHRKHPMTAQDLRGLKAAALSRGAELHDVYVESSSELDKTFEAFVRERVEGLMLEGNAAAELTPDTVGALVLKHRLPTIMTFRYSALGGVPLTYGISGIDLGRKTAVYVAKILAGAKPADLPVELPSRFEFVINMNSANRMGLKIPPAVLLRADEVIR